MEMTTSAYLLFGLLSIIPALIVLVVCFLRIEAIKGDVAEACHKVTLITKDHDHILSEYASLNTKIIDAATESHATTTRMISLEETIVALGNKWNSRERAEKTAERRKEKELMLQNQQEEVPEIPGTEQQLLFPINPPQKQPTLKRTRPFGVIP